METHQPKINKVLIVGTGVIGLIYGYALQEAGVKTTHLIKNQNDFMVQKIKLDIFDYRNSKDFEKIDYYQFQVTSRPVDEYDLVIVAVKSYQVLETISQLRYLNGSSFLILSLIWDEWKDLNKIIGQERYVLSFPNAGGSFKQKNQQCNKKVWCVLHKEIMLEKKEGIKPIQDLLQAANFKVELNEEMHDYIQIQHIFLNPFILGYARYRDCKKFRSDGDLLEKCRNGSKEFIKFLKKKGLSQKYLNGTFSLSLPGWLFRLIFRIYLRLSSNMQRAQSNAESNIEEAKYNYQKIYREALAQNIDMENYSQLFIHQN